MAVSTVISGARPGHRTARAGPDPFHGCLALDWANGQAITLSGTSQQSAVFDANNDLIVDVAVGLAATANANAWITVGSNPVAVVGAAGTMPISANFPRFIYVPAGMKIAAIQGTVAGNALTMIPALLAGN